MKYEIDLEPEMDNLLKSNAGKYGKSVSELIVDLLKRYVIDAHIMEQDEMWKSGIEECADIDLDWANL